MRQKNNVCFIGSYDLSSFDIGIHIMIAHCFETI